LDIAVVCVLKSPQDAQKIIRYAKTAKHAVVVGGSAIGIGVAAKLARVKKYTTLIELMPTLMPGRLEPDMSQMMQRFLEAQGVVVKLNQGVTEIMSKTRVKSVLTDMEEFPDDLIVFARSYRECHTRYPSCLKNGDKENLLE